MKYFFQILLFVLVGFALQGQEQTLLEKGTVSFVSSRNVYVKFSSTDNINIGDTLFVKQNDELIPALVVNNKSSTSSVCRPLFSEKMKVSDELFVKTIVKKEEPKVKKEKKKESFPQKKVDEGIAKNKAPSPVIVPEEEEEPLFKQKIKGRISASSYSNLSDYKNSHRMRYAFSFRGNNLKNSRFSTDNYITFRHTLGEWEEVRDNLSNALKVYSFSVKYDFSPTSSLTLGRKINPKFSSIGAIDGIQFERGLSNIVFLGAIAGSRPDYSDYSLNFKLPQLGAYVSLVSENPNAFRQSTLGFVEQRNRGKVDRRFVYFQHTGELLENLNLFGSFEIDLYENINNEVKNTARLTNFFISLRYRLSKKWRFSASYDNRKNIIYYESYKSFIDRLIEDETRQGLRFGINYRPFRYVSWGLNSSLRFQKSNKNVSKNLNSYISISRVPVLKARATIRANFLQTNYLDSRIFGIRLSKDIIRRKVNGDVYFRIVDYQYKSSDSTVHHKIAGASLSFRILKKLTMYLYYEGTFDEGKQTYQRFNTKIIQRF